MNPAARIYFACPCDLCCPPMVYLKIASFPANEDHFGEWFAGVRRGQLQVGREALVVFAPCWKRPMRHSPHHMAQPRHQDISEATGVPKVCLSSSASQLWGSCGRFRWNQEATNASKHIFIIMIHDAIQPLLPNICLYHDSIIEFSLILINMSFVIMHYHLHGSVA